MADSIRGSTRVAFGDVVRLSKERTNDPDADGFCRYVGLEHLDPGDLRIRRWGDVADGTTFTNVFRPGQVLFGKRRAYQRKVAVADFSGVCSGDIYVLESSDSSALLPELLPFICQSERFFEHAVGTSAGSLSPRTNWRSLSAFEFALPTLQAQSRILEALTAANLVAEKHLLAGRSVNSLINSFVLDVYRRANEAAPRRHIVDVADLRMGRQKAPKYATGKNPRPFLRVANIGHLRLDLSVVEEMDFTEKELAAFRLAAGDILLTEGDLISPLNVGRPALYNDEIRDCCFQNTLIRVRPRPELLDARFALLMLEGARLARVFAEAASTTTVTHLGLRRLADVSLPIPEMPDQRAVAERFDQLLGARDLMSRRSLEAGALLSNVTNAAIS